MTSDDNIQATNTSVSHTVGVAHSEIEVEQFDLPNDYRRLSAMKAAITQKMEEMRTSGVETLRSMILQESEALGLTPEEILGTAPKKPRGRRPRSKREE